MANKYKRKSEPLNRWVALVMALISIFMGTVFSSTLLLNQPITKQEATKLTCIYEDFKGGKRLLYDQDAELILIFKDGSRQYIDVCCVTDEVYQKVKRIAPGTEIQSLINPNNDCVVELIVNDDVLLDFDYTQKQLERNGVGFFVLGLVMYGCAIFFIVQTVLDFRKKIRRTKAKKTNK